MNDIDATPSGPELVLTMNAVDRLRALLEESGDTDCKLRIRVVEDEDGPTFQLSLEDASEPDDVELDYARIAIVLDPESRAHLRGHELDHRRDDHGEQFVIRRA